MDERVGSKERADLRQALGDRMRKLRRQLDITLQEASARTGLATSTLSKIENGRMSPTYDNLLRIASGYSVGIEALFARGSPDIATTRYTITRRNEGKVLPTQDYRYEMLCTSLSRKQIIPIVSTVKRHTFSGPEDFVRHIGEEMVYVLSGRVEVYLEHYEPFVLEVGDCTYFDSTMGHALISKSEEDAQILWVCTHGFE